MNLTSAWLLALIAALCALPWLVKWLQRRTGRGPGGQSDGARLVSGLALGPQQRVVTVEVGSGLGRVQLVLGVTPQSITCLHVLPMPVQNPVPVRSPVVAGATNRDTEPSFAVELKEHAGV